MARKTIAGDCANAGVAITANGAEYLFRLDHKAVCAIKAKLGPDIVGPDGKMKSSPSVTLLLDLFSSGLSRDGRPCDRAEAIKVADCLRMRRCFQMIYDGLLATQLAANDTVRA